jgi:hypothetical protein
MSHEEERAGEPRSKGRSADEILQQAEAAKRASEDSGRLWLQQHQNPPPPPRERPPVGWYMLGFVVFLFVLMLIVAGAGRLFGDNAWVGFLAFTLGGFVLILALEGLFGRRR